jgi:FMN phosphatase YigB (HAD superfamily)
MPLTLEQYADFLDTRDLVWPLPPEAKPAKAKPHLSPRPGVRAVTWSLYGTLLNISKGQLLFEHPDKFVMGIALDKTVQEFKMWGSMSRKPGQPADYMGEIYRRVMDDMRMAPSKGEKHPEIVSERIWDAILKKLNQKDYKYDVNFYGPIGDYCKKIAYFFHASLQGTACNEGAAQVLEHLHHAGIKQGVIADGQCFSFVQLQRGLKAQQCGVGLDQLIDRSLRTLSCDVGGRKPSERLFKNSLSYLSMQGLAANQVMHVGSSIQRDVAPAKKLGMRTALYTGDLESLDATKEQLKDPATRPDTLLTELSQLADVVGMG